MPALENAAAAYAARLEAVRQLWHGTDLSAVEIAQRVRMSESAIRKMRAREGWPPRRPGMMRQRRVVTFETEGGAQPTARTPLCPGLDFCPARAAVVARLWHTVEQQVSEAQARLTGPLAAAKEEHDDAAKLLASLARTLKELYGLDAAGGSATARPARSPAPAPAEDSDDDAVPLDAESLRAELARRLEALLAQPDGGLAGEPEAG
jgi:hypothetical protein